MCPQTFLKFNVHNLDEEDRIKCITETYTLYSYNMY